jgi:hypothetical protein
MKRDTIIYKGIEYPIIEIARNLIDSEWKDSDSSVTYIIADIELWLAIEKDYENDNSAAIEIDNSIFYYCDSGFVASKPTEEEVIEYFDNI